MNQRRSRTRRAVTCSAVLLCAILAAIAQAQVESPADTELTPTPKEPVAWSIVSGAKYRGDGRMHTDPNPSPTPYTVDFFTTSFSPEFVSEEEANPEGFFGGAECIDEGTPFEDQALKECERRPALYRFWIDEVGDEHIAKVPTEELVDDPEEEGFIGAVGWIDSTTALAVGGTGAYPRREPSPPSEGYAEDGESDDAAYLRKDREGEEGSSDKPTGYARAWIYEDPDGDGPKERSWRELSDDELREDPDGDGALERMGAMTALDCTQDDVRNTGTAGNPLVIPKGTCVAGGLQRFWWWRPPTADTPEGFDTDPVTDREVVRKVSTAQGPNPNQDPTGRPDFHHRVRQIDVTGAYSFGAVRAVTTGCCVSRVQLKQGPDGLPNGAPDTALGAREINYSGTGDFWESRPSLSVLSNEDAGALGAPFPDSLFSFSVAAPGGAPTPGQEEPGSRIVGIHTVDDQALKSVRLLAAGGNGRSKGVTDDAVQGGSSGGLGQSTGPVWMVGSLKEESFEGTAQGVAYTLLEPVAFVPAPLSCPLGTFLQNQGGNCEPVPENITNYSLESKRLIGMGTYALHALQFVPKTTKAWAAGDRGALARLGAAGGLGAEIEPHAPHLRPGTAAPLADQGPFESLRPSSGTPGTVPPRASRPVEKLPRPEMVPYGSGDPSRYLDLPVDLGGLPYESVTSMAMSRDGSEGWALGSQFRGSDNDGGAPTLQHFDGERWARCAADGLNGAHEPDRACTVLVGLDQGTGSLTPFNLITVARIPLERDGDPTNDDEFEAIALGVRPRDPQGRKSTVLVYHDGVWRLDDDASRVIDTGGPVAPVSIAFRTPSDGWLAANHNPAGYKLALYHYGGGSWPNGRWVACMDDLGRVVPENSAECGGAEGVERLSDPLGVTHGFVQAAGDTVFVAGNRRVFVSTNEQVGGDARYPFVYSRQPGQPWRYEHDPGCEEVTTSPTGTKSCRPRRSDDSDPFLDEDQGEIASFSAVDLGGGRVTGWLLGRFGRQENVTASGLLVTNDFNRPVKGPKYVLMRRDPDAPPGSGEVWSHRTVDDAAEDYLPYIWGAGGANAETPSLVSFRGGDGRERSFISTSGGLDMRSQNPPLEYDSVKDRWRVMPAPMVASTALPIGGFGRGEITAIAPDNRGGLWIAARVRHTLPDSATGGRYRDMNSHTANFYYRYTDRRPKAVFEDSPTPISEEITDLDGTADGTVWVSTETEKLYRYDRVGGWQRVSIPRWDVGRVVTRHSRAYALAVNDSGIGIAVGEQGRIANISPGGVALDPATIHRCSDAPPPCGTPRTLRAAAVAPDGSAMAGGDRLTLSWRPANGPFRLVNAPRSSVTVRITGLSMPDPSHVWATLENGEIWAGTLTDPNARQPWRWIRESAAGAARDERANSFFPNGVSHLFAVEVDSSGRGLAVGYRGAMLERSPDGSWKRLTGFLDNFFSIALPPQGYGDGTVVGGGSGVILTRANGRFHVARPGDHLDPLVIDGVEIYDGRIVGATIAGGSEDGETEAWAALQGNYDESWRTRNPPPHALFHYASGDDPTLDPEARAAPLADAPKEQPGELSLAAFGRSDCQPSRDGCRVFAGTNLFNDLLARRINTEVIDRARGSTGPVAAISTGDLNEAPGRDDVEMQAAFVLGPHTLNEPNVIHHQWRQFVADPLLENGVPTFATLGERDLSRIRNGDLSRGYWDSRELLPGGLTKQWREAFATMPAPWGSSGAYSSDGYEYRPVDGGSPVRHEAPGGGARTHYALDVVKDGDAIARLVFLDSSNGRSLAASDPNQNPVEGQQAWLEEVLTRPADLPAVVITNTPPYSYGPGTFEQTLAESAALESTLLRHRVSALITGRMGWNGLYYTFAPGLHFPQPGGAQPDSTEPPSGPGDDRGPGSGSLPADPAGLEAGGSGVLPTVIASSAGGQFGPRGRDNGPATEGFWHGYSVVRIDPSGDPAKTIVEQRPILDWVGISGRRHVLRPAQRLPLEGFGREPLGVDTTIRVNEISNPAITHRFDLVEADPDKPWLPKEAEDNGVTNQASQRLGEEDPCGPYRCLDPSIGTIDDQSGRVKAGNGNYPRTYALAVLSVGEETATWPIVFEARASYRPPVPSIPRPSLPPPPPYPSQPPQPGAPSVEPPPPPVLPPTQTALTPDAIVPPTPPSYGNASPIDLGIAPVAIVAPPPTVVLQPPNPVVQPAPPSGARREARQRQAASQRSGLGAEQGSGEAQELGGDGAGAPDAPHGSGMTRHEFRALAAREQPSAWARDALIGGGLTLAALLLALGVNAARPTPRRRPPEEPAPAYARNHRR